MDFIDAFTITKSENSEVTITGEIPHEELAKSRGAALAALGKHIKVDGFREGHVPESVLIGKIGEGTLLSEMAERTIARIYPEAVKHHKLDVVGYPQIQITKLAPGNPLGFTATVAIMPTITLPDYKKIAQDLNKEKASSEVTDEDIDAQAKDILRQKAAYERLQSKAGETHTHEDGRVHEGPSHDDHAAHEADDAEITTPELTDELVKTLGQPGQFESVADFKAKLREHLQIEKKRETDAAHRAKITDAIVEQSSFAIPKIMIESELSQMFGQMEEDLKRANLTLADYLTHIKKTREDLVAEWSPAAEKRARLQLILNDIAKKEAVTPDAKALEEEVAHLKEHYKDADEARVRTYVASVLQNEAVMKMLESQ